MYAHGPLPVANLPVLESLCLSINNLITGGHDANHRRIDNGHAGAANRCQQAELSRTNDVTTSQHTLASGNVKALGGEGVGVWRDKGRVEGDQLQHAQTHMHRHTCTQLICVSLQCERSH